jgi:hypothetical protein
MTHRQDIVSSLILVPIRSGLRGFCLFILEIFLKDYQQKNPLKYYALPFLFEFVNKVHFRTKDERNAGANDEDAKRNVRNGEGKVRDCGAGLLKR